VRLARLSNAPFTDRLVSKFNLPVSGWRDRVGSGHVEVEDVPSDPADTTGQADTTDTTPEN
jgi:NAD+ kinase